MRRLLALIAVILTFSVVACTAPPSRPHTTEPPLELTLTMRDIAFEPDVIEVDRGVLVRLNFENRGAVVHDFTIDSMPLRAKRMSGGLSGDGHAHHGAATAMHLALPATGHGMIEFEATEPGEYVYYCDEPGHRDAGMHGILRVR